MFNNAIVFITGGASGLGHVLVDEFVKEGAKVFFTYKKSESKANALCEKYKDKVVAYKADACSFEEAQQAVGVCLEKYGTIDILVNNAASAIDASLQRITFDDFDFTLKNVLYPVFNYSKCVAPIMVEKNKGKIINIGSINGIRGREGSLAYSTAKAGVVGFTKTIAKELGRYSVCCNVVAPGFINTDGQEKTSELIKKVVLDECAIRRLSEPVEIANLIMFLASDKADNITGQVYQIDCGQYI